MSSPPSSPGPPTDSELNDVAARTEARYAALVERAGYGIYRSSPDGRFLDVNSVLVAMLGYSRPSELLALDLSRDVYLDPEERDRRIDRHPNQAYPGWIETRWKRRDGTAIVVKLSVRRVLDATGAIEFYDGIAEDVTERKRQDDLLRRSERMASLGTTLAGVAHELNNPLAAIMGFAQLLLRKPWPAEDLAALETINHEAIRSATIVKDLLAMARKRDIVRRVATDVNDVVGYVIRTRRYSLETAGIICTVELEPSLPLVHGDRAQLEQALLNLLSNAEQALRTKTDGAPQSVGARIALRTRSDERDVIIEVQDNGPGIPLDVQSRIWDPFWTTKEEGEGTGLGLAVVYAIVSEHGGTISLDDTTHSGARFVIRLPIAIDIVLPVSVGHAAQPLDVLVVDPGASDLLFVERFLTSRGHAVVNAGSGDLAIRLANQTVFDAIVCDARLVGRSGKLVAKALRETTGGAGARFVLSAAVSPDAHLPPAPFEGATVVCRPYDIEELRRLIEGD